MKLSDLTSECKLKPRDISTLLTGLGMAGLKPTSVLTETQEATLRAIVAYKKQNPSKRLTWGRAVSEWIADNPQDTTQVRSEAHAQSQQEQATQTTGNGQQPQSVEPEAVPLTAEALEADPHHQVQEEADGAGVSAMQTVVSELAQTADAVTSDLAEGFLVALYQGTALKMTDPKIHNAPRVQAAKAGFKAIMLTGGTSSRPFVKSLPSQTSPLLPEAKTQHLSESNSRSIVQSGVQLTKPLATAVP